MACRTEESTTKKNAPQDAEGNKETIKELKCSVFETVRKLERTSTFTHAQYRERAASPPDIAPDPDTLTQDEIDDLKLNVPAFLNSASVRKTREEVEAHNSQVAFVVDIDRHQDIDELCQMLDGLQLENYDVNSTASATAEEQRLRLLLMLASPIAVERGMRIQKGLRILLDGDKKMDYPWQLSFMPVRGRFYKHAFADGPYLDANDDQHPLIVAALAALAEWEVKERKEAEAFAAHEKRQQKQEREERASPDHIDGQITGIQVIRQYNQEHPIEDQLARLRYEKDRSGRWRPQGSSSPHGIAIKDDKMFSHHSSDPMCDGFWHDSFDLFVEYDHHGDRKVAIQKAANDLRTDTGETISQHNKRKHRKAKAKEQAGQQDGTKAKGKAKEKPFLDMRSFALNGRSAVMKEEMQNAVYFVGKISIMGQATVIYAKPNTGKTLLVIALLIRAIKAGTIKPEDVFYVNVDDNEAGFIEKLEIAEQNGFNMLGFEINGFTPKKMAEYMITMVEQGTARGKVFILDTLKKFTNLMEKDESTNFIKAVRRFCLEGGGTVLMMAHTNKNRADDGSLVHAGTSDVVDDSDCAYILDSLEKDSGTRTVVFTKLKGRGGVVEKAAYSYSTKATSYRELVDSVREISDKEAEQADKEQMIKDRVEKNKTIITAIVDAIKAGIVMRTEIIAAARAETSETPRRINAVLDEHTGKEWAAGHRWTMEKGEKNTKRYTLLMAWAHK